MLWFFVCWFTIAIVISLVYSQIGYLFCVLYSPQARFPLLKLDYVAIREVLSTLDPHDYINFLKVSKSCRRLSTIKKHSKVRLIFKNFPRIIIGNGPGNYYVMWAQKVDTRAPCKQQECIKCSQNCLNDMKKFYQDVRSVMGVEISSVVLHMDDFQGRCSEIVSWFRSISQEVVDLSIYGENPRHGEIQYLLDNLKCRDRLRIDVNTIEQLPFKIPESINTLFIIQGSWITLDYVMSLKISRMSFRNTYLTNQDINAFYKSWIEMESHQNLECFEINLINPANFVAVALRDIPNKTGTPIPKLFPDYAAIRGSFEVTRKDGQEASIVVFDLPEGAVASIYPWLPLINTEPIDRQ